MWNNNSGQNKAGFSGILGKITRTGPSRITQKETFEPMAPAAAPIDPIHAAKMAALSGLQAASMNPSAHIPVPHLINPSVGEPKKDKFLGVLRSRQ